MFEIAIVYFSRSFHNVKAYFIILNARCRPRRIVSMVCSFTKQQHLDHSVGYCYVTRLKEALKINLLSLFRRKAT